MAKNYLNHVSFEIKKTHICRAMRLHRKMAYNTLLFTSGLIIIYPCYKKLKDDENFEIYR